MRSARPRPRPRPAPATPAARGRLRTRFAAALRAAAGILVFLPAVHAGANDLPEYRLKAAFLYNFALFTEWPADDGWAFNLCIHGPDPFGGELSALHGKNVGQRSIVVQRAVERDELAQCQMVFVAAAAMPQLSRVLQALEGRPVLLVADSPGAARQGVAVNMALEQSRVTFEVNLKAAREAGLTPSAKLLRLATQVHQ